MRTRVIVELALPMIAFLAVIRPSLQDSKVSGDLGCTGKPCSNGGECIDVGSGYMCKCQKGFGGKQCQEAHMCEFNPCSHGATCVETANTYKCACAWGFSGPKCETEVTCTNQNPCRNGATCQQKDGVDIICTCKEGFTGLLCEDPLVTMEGMKQVCGDAICRPNERCEMTETKLVTKYHCVCRAGETCRVHGQSGGPAVNLGVHATLLLIGVCSASVIFVILVFTVFGALYNMKYAPLIEDDLEKGDHKTGYTSAESGAESGGETGEESADNGADSHVPDFGSGPDSGTDTGGESDGEKKSHGKGHKARKASKDSKAAGDTGSHKEKHGGKDKGHGKDKGGKEKGGKEKGSKDKGKGHGDKKGHKHK